MPTDNVQQLAHTIEDVNTHKGANEALNAFQQEYMDYSKTHTKEQTAATFKQVEETLGKEDKQSLLAVTAKWGQQHKDYLADTDEISQRDLLMYRSLVTDVASPFDKYMSQVMSDNFKTIAAAHRDNTFSDKANITFSDLDQVLTNNESTRKTALDKEKSVQDNTKLATPFVGNNAEMFEKIARQHLSDTNKNDQRITYEDLQALAGADKAAQKATGHGIVSDQERLALQDLLTNWNTPKFASWRSSSDPKQDTTAYPVITLDNIAKACGYAKAADMEAALKK